MQNYLTADSDLINQEKKNAFKVIDVRANIKNKHLNVTCVACQTENIINEETQEHI